MCCSQTALYSQSSGCSGPTLHWLLKYTSTPFLRCSRSQGSHPASDRSGMLPGNKANPENSQTVGQQCQWC